MRECRGHSTSRSWDLDYAWAGIWLYAPRQRTSRQRLSSSLSAWQREQSMKRAVQLLTFSSVTNALELI